MAIKDRVEADRIWAQRLGRWLYEHDHGQRAWDALDEPERQKAYAKGLALARYLVSEDVRLWA